MKIVKIKSLLFIVMLSMCTVVHSNELPCPGCPEQNPEFPIDGGLSFLIIAGTAYGAYELRKNKK